MREFPAGTCSFVFVIDTLSGAAGRYFCFQTGAGGGSLRPGVFVVSAGGNFGFCLPARVRTDGPTQLAREKELVASGDVQMHLCEMQKNGGVWSLPVLAHVRHHPPPEGLAAWPIGCGRGCWLRVFPQKRRHLGISWARNNNRILNLSYQNIETLNIGNIDKN